ncbi:unnamed protein product [Amoebophrya sp. A25]|nr:unnamed protein product [Amoebophrya sp. A25]|eukprot:GSA25T00023617001.1
MISTYRVTIGRCIFLFPVRIMLKKDDHELLVLRMKSIWLLNNL